ncbi:hypothetical protein KEM55_006065 [Ascosphaera atra]|nr:hypothetical protein KEM55_006065 [Ascosphaera atra]
MEPEQQKHIPRDHKESYEHRRFRNEQCPTPDELAKFDASIADYREALDEFYQQCFKLSKEVLRCLAIALKLPGGEKFFEGMMEEADPQLRLLHYPPRPVEAIASAASNDGKDSRIKPHCDYGFCTLLFQDSVGGLEVDPFHTGNYTPAPPKEGTVLINIGDLLNRLLNNRVKSTMHRVVAPPVKPTANGSGVQMLPSRYSIPFFVHPHPSFDIDPVLLDKDEKKLYKSVNAGEWRAWRTSLLYDFKDQEKEYLNKLGIQESEVAGLTRG